MRPSVRVRSATAGAQGRRIRYWVTELEDEVSPTATPAPWALNLHGNLADGTTYRPESLHLARTLGWRVLTPDLPGFGRSDPARAGRPVLAELAERVGWALDHAGAGPIVVLGHSMGAAVAVALAHARRAQVLGLICRDGVTTPGWKQRRSPLAVSVPFLGPDLALLVDLGIAAALEAPSLVTRRPAGLRSVLPGRWRAALAAPGTLAAGAAMLTLDLRPELGDLRQAGIPMLGVWGRGDRVVGRRAAEEFAAATGAAMHQVPGGHSWMLRRPERQAEMLVASPAGQAFLEAVAARHARYAAGQPVT
ncbi:MAG TPA: alpha/beta fold hydrolase [Acidimicrobiales bacterium]